MLAAQQQVPSLLDGSSGIFGELRVRRATDGMADDREFIIRHAQHAAHHLSRAHESRRHHADGGNTLSFCCDGVVQTARRAAPSIPYAGNNGLPSLDLVSDRSVRGGAVI